MDVGVLNSLGYIEVIEISFWLGIKYLGKSYIDNYFKDKPKKEKSKKDKRKVLNG